VAYTIGITGGIGSGKTTVANLFGELGATVVDTDLISHQVTNVGQPALVAIREQLGPEYLDDTGALDRSKVRQRVFSDPSARKVLESIVHPLIRSETLRQIEASRGPYTLLVVPLLIEKDGYKGLVDRVLVVDCQENQQIARTMARSGLRADEVRAIMASQASRNARLQAADDVIENTADLGATLRDVERLHALYSQLGAKA
jgi:dephospho-CoA kinase